MWITRKIEFSASHSCYNPLLSEAENRALYGSESNPAGHGHNYALEVTLEGEPDTLTGMVVDLKQVKGILEREVVDSMDHRHLNHEVPPFENLVPTTENLAVEIWKRLEPHFPAGGARLRNVRLYETGDLFVDYEGR